MALADKCLFISSYHKGYAWSDGVERGLRNELSGKCELKQFDMDTKRNKDEAYKKDIALKAKSLIESWQPDVVITADDNAARYLIQPYYKNHRTPFVFCGINWDAAAYGFPYDNVTGMIEVAPIAALFDKARTIQRRLNSIVYIGADTLTEKKNMNRFKTEAASLNIRFESRLAKTSDEWISYYQQSQHHDLIIMGSNSGINDWDKKHIKTTVLNTTKTLTMTNHSWMMPYTILGLTKVPEEQGIWAAQTALYILRGTKPADIPIVANRKWDIWVNEAVLKNSRLEIPGSMLHKAKKVQ
jgi:ABC-type uncharacterized transport system substrate-binding protein